MTGTLIRIFTGVDGFVGGVIKADGEFFNCYASEWIDSPVPRDGQYIFEEGQRSFTVGQRVTFTPQPGTIEPGGTFETASTAVNVQAA